MDESIESYVVGTRYEPLPDGRVVVIQSWSNGDRTVSVERLEEVMRAIKGDC